MEPTNGAGPYSIGSDIWPGLSKLIEEAGEVLQVGGKLLGTGGNPQHWDGSNLRERMLLELADLHAAIVFFLVSNYDSGTSEAEFKERRRQKLEQFEAWHQEGWRNLGYGTK